MDALQKAYNFINLAHDLHPNDQDKRIPLLMESLAHSAITIAEQLALANFIQLSKLTEDQANEVSINAQKNFPS